MRRKRTGRPKTKRIHNEMDEVQSQQIKKRGWCRIEGHKRKKCPYRLREVGESSTQPNVDGAVNIIRGMLDRLRVDQFVWTPYTIVRQFGLQQTIPQDPPNFDKLHKMDLRGKHEYNWPQKHEVWIRMWESREDYLVNGVPDNEALYHHSQYMQ
ncbi:hypothetical protein Lal_00038565 [Lupinus albus]|nr:hypothetical protein Lal_00038565 [Lupinus albus]